VGNELGIGFGTMIREGVGSGFTEEGGFWVIVGYKNVAKDNSCGRWRL